MPQSQSRKSSATKLVKDDLIRNYAKNRWKYQQLSTLVRQFLEWKVRELLPDMLTSVLHKAESRAKSYVSLRKNLDSGRYSDPRNIRDLAATRLIFYFRDDLDEFERRADLNYWFGPAAAESTEWIKGGLDKEGKRNDAIPGYESHHFTLEVTARTLFFDALHHEDQQHLLGLRCEVQMRTILQHAWAETEHDLRYKLKRNGHEVPDNVDRRFRQLSASVESNDDLLVTVRRDIATQLRTTLSSASLVNAGWTYQGIDQRGILIGSVRYGYSMEDIPTSNDDKSPGIEQSSEVFDADAAMARHAGIVGFKQKMWDLLQDEEPQFMSNIVHDSTVVRVCGWNRKDKVLRVQPAHYSDQVVTNHKKALTRRLVVQNSTELTSVLNEDPNGQFLTFEESPFSNTLGVCCILRVQKRWMISQRSGFVAYEPGMWGCSASGALEWTELGHWGLKTFDSWITGGMSRELYEETGYRALLSQFQYLGFGREFGRSGKPQIFFCLDVPDKSTKEMEYLWKTYTTSRPEFQDLLSSTTSRQKRWLVETQRRLET